MKFTLDWIKDYLDTNASPDEIAGCLTSIGLEIDSVDIPVVPIAAKIIECDPVSGSDRLSVLQVDDGTGVLRQIVCGAPNVRVGLVSALALPGCKIGDVEIKSGKIRGVLSDGMMCSEKELGRGDDHTGIIELSENYEIGNPISESTIVFEAGITPNRPDYLAVKGIARDLASAGMGDFKNQNNTWGIKEFGHRKAEIKNLAACPVYRLCEIHGIKMASSNPVIARRLAAIGINPKSVPVDATNYVCYDLGQPMHCFDADEIKGDIIIRNAIDGEKFTDLFGSDHILSTDDLVIADQDGILALAGIVGGARGMTTPDTKNILLESAYFEPVGIRKTRRRLCLSTDSSYRYERGIDPTITEKALDMAVKIITDACGGGIVGAYTAGENPAESREIKYFPNLFKQKTGIDLAVEKQKEILEKLDFSVVIKGDEWTIIPPPARIDIEIPENIISELIRIYGYDKIESIGNSSLYKDRQPVRIDKSAIKLKLASLGLTESVSYGFGDSEKEKLLSSMDCIMVKNPIVATFDTARSSLVQNMLDIIAANDRFKRSNLNLFEIGTVFSGDQPGEQHTQLIISRTGITGSNIGVKHGRPVEIYDVRADLISLFDGGVIENDPVPQKWANPYRAGCVIKDGVIVARFAELHPVIAKKFGIKTRVVLGVVDNINVLPTQKVNQQSDINNQPSINDFPDFPMITRDFAFIVDNKISSDDIVAAISAENTLVYETNVFDVFDMGGGKKSVALEIVIQPVTNMSDTDLLDLQNKIIRDIENKFDAKIRDR
ncbi:MAG: phenylalanine--tRNA ligase subunit beta [Alphaproteobacteria bacterium]|nr:phenylalanine--tRNA ligase subunit beta [Alphaproteobacteria bacterium]